MLLLVHRGIARILPQAVSIRLLKYIQYAFDFLFFFSPREESKWKRNEKKNRQDEDHTHTHTHTRTHVGRHHHHRHHCRCRRRSGRALIIIRNCIKKTATYTHNTQCDAMNKIVLRFIIIICPSRQCSYGYALNEFLTDSNPKYILKVSLLFAVAAAVVRDSLSMS